MKISRKIYRDYVYKDKEILRAQYDPELEFYTTIKSGDIEKAKELCLAKISEKEGLGELSDSPLQSLKYHFAITMAMLARYCIEGGLDLSTSYALSDFYIQEADRVSTMDELNTLHTTACLDYARRMKNLRKKKITSKPISKCLDYIYDHLHTRITLSRLAELTGLNSSYLSRLFHKETGMTVTTISSRQRLKLPKICCFTLPIPQPKLLRSLHFQIKVTSQKYSKTDRTDTKAVPVPKSECLRSA